MKQIILFVTSFFLVQTSYAFKKSPIRIASYNLENFWDSLPNNTANEWNQYRLSLPPKERGKLPGTPQYLTYSDKYSNWHKETILNAKIENVIRVLNLMKTPDIVALQEIESANNKSKVFDTPYRLNQTFRSKLLKLGYKYIILGKQEKNNPVSVTTAFISKIKISSLKPVEIRSNEHSTSARDLQVVLLELPKERVVLINNHWKSKRGGNEEVRVNIAKILQRRIERERKHSKKTHTIILGDLNSEYYEKPLVALGTTDDKKIFKEGASSLLYNLWYELPPRNRWESSFNGVRKTLSHILLSDSLFDQDGFHYKNNSFEVVGQKEPEKSILLDVSGQPFRWQIRYYYDWYHHIGKGYSDHLPLVAEFYANYPRYLANKISARQTPEKDDNSKLDVPKRIYFNEIKPCSENDAINLLKIKYQSVEDLNKKCVKLEMAPSMEALELKTRGKYQQNFIKIPINSRGYKDELVLGITMTGRYDWRPNINDSRITYEEASITKGLYNDKNWHPRSNKCFVRKKLQRKGGSLRKVLGRVGYSDGYFSIHIASREASQIQLENLPLDKKLACPW